MKKQIFFMLAGIALLGASCRKDKLNLPTVQGIEAVPSEGSAINPNGKTTDEGSGIDPHGKASGSCIDPNGLARENDVSVRIDPNGLARETDAGVRIDPDGRTNAKESGTSLDPSGKDAGSSMDPNGRTKSRGWGFDPNGKLSAVQKESGAGPILLDWMAGQRSIRWGKRIRIAGPVWIPMVRPKAAVR